MPPDEPNKEERLEELPGDDGQTPFRPADDSQDDTRDHQDRDAQSQASAIDDTSPITDSDIDAHDLYDEGLAGAVGAHEPNAGNAVVGYTPPPDPEITDEDEEA